jgi:hypothetical protein
LVALTGAIVLVEWGPSIVLFWRSESADLGLQFSGNALLALAIGAVSWLPLNVLVSKEWAWKRIHESGMTSALERLFFEAFVRKSFLQITLKSDKVYVVMIKALPESPKDSPCLAFVPLKSGYRKKETKVIVETTDYAAVLKRKVDADSTPSLRRSVAAMTKVVPLSEILVASVYSERLKDKDFKIPKRKRKSKRPPSQPPIPTGAIP